MRRKKTEYRSRWSSRSNWAIVGAIAAAALSFWLWTTRREADDSTGPSSGVESDAEVFAAYAGSKACRGCHEEAYNRWSPSHHALAERDIDPASDHDLFVPQRQFKHGSQNSQARIQDGRYEVVTLGADGARRPHRVARVIGVKPLLQFLVAAEEGRFQVTELAADPARGDWFDVFGDEDRKPGEWGHWTGRGMTWNTMCAACHNTRVRKNYAPASDSYATSMAEMGVGCEACHGPMAAHAKWQRAQGRPGAKDPTLRPIDTNRMLETCGTCHSRRVELTGEFRPGESFLDHYSLTIPDETDIYYPDGQVREENYEYASFLGSRMFAAGVSCMDCHDPHSGKTLAPDNSLCLGCHGSPEPPMRKIEPAQHGHHPPDSAGGRCVDCHMPQTTYMQRHPRRDHGFTIPDPLLTQEHGIPNACNRCHTDRTSGWALETVMKWYGPLMNRHTRTRARWIAEARAGSADAQESLIRMVDEEKIPLWRASAAILLKPWAGDQKVSEALVRASRDGDALVRTMAARSLEALAQATHPAGQSALRSMLDDPARSVRTEAAWALRGGGGEESKAVSELMRYFEVNSDNPSGMLQKGLFLLDRGDLEGALAVFRRAVSWDRGSPPLRHALAITLSARGDTEEAVAELEAACRLDPRDAELRYKLGLALNEAGKLEQAAAALAEAVKLEPRFSRAWYNLGLAYSALGRPESALMALGRAESLDSGSSRIPYARATILTRMGRTDEARRAASRALELQPNFAEAAALLQMLNNR